jgi:GDPmannose 4,6-dehydratase
VTRKITRGTAAIALGMQDKLWLGNLGAQRDWGHARDYVEAMWKMLQADQAEDFVIATGVTTTVRNFCTLSFREAGIEIGFEGEGVEEKGIVRAVHRPDVSVRPGQVVIAVDPRYFRPAEVDLLVGDASKARQQLGWEPRHTLADLVREMVAADLQLFSRQKFLKEGGFDVKTPFE